jgi:hypothetical protein
MIEAGKAVSSTVRRPPHTFEAGEAMSHVDNNDEAFDNSEDNSPEINGHSTSTRRPSARGNRKATLKHDVAFVDCGHESGEALVDIKPKVSGAESRIVKPRGHGTRKRHQKPC